MHSARSMHGPQAGCDQARQPDQPCQTELELLLSTMHVQYTVSHSGADEHYPDGSIQSWLTRRMKMWVITSYWTPLIPNNLCSTC